jgi:hypothetical protein
MAARQAVLDLHERIRAVFADDRFPTDIYGRQVRSLAVAMLWVAATGRGPGLDHDWWQAVAQAMCFPPGQAHWLIQQTIRADLPRYAPPEGDTGITTCQAPAPGGEGLCGRSVTRGCRVSDPGTGRWRLAGWCSRHTRQAAAAEAAERDLLVRGVPEPDPNVGGLLACHVPALDWARTYAWADPTWVPPRLGVRRDDWPAPDTTTTRALQVLPGGGEPAPGDPPVLTVIPHPLPHPASGGRTPA